LKCVASRMENQSEKPTQSKKKSRNIYTSSYNLYIYLYTNEYLLNLVSFFGISMNSNNLSTIEHTQFGSNLKITWISFGLNDTDKRQTKRILITSNGECIFKYS